MSVITRLCGDFGAIALCSDARCRLDRCRTTILPRAISRYRYTAVFRNSISEIAKMIEKPQMSIPLFGKLMVYSGLNSTSGLKKGCGTLRIYERNRFAAERSSAVKTEGAEWCVCLSVGRLVCRNREPCMNS